MTPDLSQKVAEFCRKNNILRSNDTIVVGVSGGPDSICLLHILKTLAVEFHLNLTIAHLNHQLREQAQDEANFVQEIATRWNLPFFSEAHNIAKLAKERKESIEKTARQIRYKFLWQVARKIKANKIAVGHHADDQAETVLMHFLRGTGLTGLHGMLPVTDINSLELDIGRSQPQRLHSPPKLIRPLLETSRAEIETCCQANNLPFHQDLSNQDTTFFRNRLRHDLLPYLETYNPNIRQALQRTAKIISADIEQLNEQIDRAWQAVIRAISSTQVDFDFSKWSNLSLSLKRATLRRAIQTLQRSLRDISFEQIENAIDQLEAGNTGKKVTLPHSLVLTVGYDTFSLGLDNAFDEPDGPYLISNEPLLLNLSGVTKLSQAGWQVKATLMSLSDFDRSQLDKVDRWEAFLDAEVVGQAPVLRPRQPGDIFCPLGMGGHHKKVSDFMIDEKISAAQRNHIPLLVTDDDQILWACGYRLDERASVRPTTQQILHLKFEIDESPA